jgi:hypothetical protein
MDSEEVRVNKDAMDVDTAETIAGVVRLLRRAAVLAWAPQTARASDRLASCSLWASTWPDEARQLVPVDTDLDGPVGVGDDPAGLLTSASLLLCRLTALGASDALLDLQAAVANLVWEANTGVTRTGIDMRSVGAPLAVSTDRK